MDKEFGPTLGCPELYEAPEFNERNCFALKFLDTKHTYHDFDTASSSSVLLSRALFDMVVGFSNWKKMAARTHREIHDVEQAKKMVHSSRVILPLVNMSASWFLVSTYLFWNVGSFLILSNNQYNVTLWVRDTCLIVGLLPFMIILITASLSSKMYN